MNSLDLINEEIKRLEVVINVHIEDDFQEYMSYSDDCPEKQELLTNLYKEAERCNQELQILYQIKAKLEAWGIAKAKGIDILSVKTASDLESFNIDLVKEYQLTDYEFKTLIKALEVEHEI